MKNRSNETIYVLIHDEEVCFFSHESDTVSFALDKAQPHAGEHFLARMNEFADSLKIKKAEVVLLFNNHGIFLRNDTLPKVNAKQLDALAGYHYSQVFTFAKGEYYYRHKLIGPSDNGVEALFSAIPQGLTDFYVNLLDGDLPLTPRSRRFGIKNLKAYAMAQQAASLSGSGLVLIMFASNRYVTAVFAEDGRFRTLKHIYRDHELSVETGRLFGFYTDYSKADKVIAVDDIPKEVLEAIGSEPVFVRAADFFKNWEGL